MCVGLCDGGLDAIFQALRRECEKLTEIDLSHNRISDAGVQRLAAEFCTGTCPCLRDLWLCGNPFGTEGKFVPEQWSDTTNECLVSQNVGITGPNSAILGAQALSFAAGDQIKRKGMNTMGRVLHVDSDGDPLIQMDEGDQKPFRAKAKAFELVTTLANEPQTMTTTTQIVHGEEPNLCVSHLHLQDAFAPCGDHHPAITAVSLDVLD